MEEITRRYYRRVEKAVNIDSKVSTLREVRNGMTSNPADDTPTFTTHESLVEAIVDWIGRAIIEGRLRPNDDLNSVELARRFNTSRTPVREALLRLHSEGLVALSPRRRPRVAPISLSEVREMYELRAALYALVSHSIVAHASDADLTVLRSLCGKLIERVRAGDVDGYFWANVAFRDKELEACGNRQIKRALDVLRLRTHQFRHVSTSLPDRMRRSVDDHLRLCQAYEDRDPIMAAALNRSIVLTALRAIEEAWDGLALGDPS
jgi:DNA-binding GntR family transcriptional regulator